MFSLVFNIIYYTIYRVEKFNKTQLTNKIENDILMMVKK